MRVIMLSLIENRNTPIPAVKNPPSWKVVLMGPRKGRLVIVLVSRARERNGIPENPRESGFPADYEQVHVSGIRNPHLKGIGI